jgi:hypothetical protein
VGGRHCRKPETHDAETCQGEERSPIYVCHEHLGTDILDRGQSRTGYGIWPGETMTEDDVKAIILDVVAAAGLTPRPLMVNTDDDGGRNIEMWSARWRIMVSLELDPEQSGWHVVSKDVPPVLGDLSSLENLRTGLADALRGVR